MYKSMQLTSNPSSYLYNQVNFDFNENTYLSSANKSLPPRILGAKSLYSIKDSSKRTVGHVSLKRKCKYELI